VHSATATGSCKRRFGTIDNGNGTAGTMGVDYLLSRPTVPFLELRQAHMHATLAISRHWAHRIDIIHIHQGEF
jgi:hypothetical protein